MRRVISLYLPHWPSDRLRRMRREFSARDKPLVTAIMQGQRRILASVDKAAARVGLSVGMTVTHAQSLIPDLTVSEGTPEEDEAALFRLALWCIKYSPLVTPNPPDGVFIDVAGSAHLFQGEAARRSRDYRPGRARRHSGLRVGHGALWQADDRFAGRAPEASNGASLRARERL